MALPVLCKPAPGQDALAMAGAGRRGKEKSLGSEAGKTEGSGR